MKNLAINRNEANVKGLERKYVIPKSNRCMVLLSDEGTTARFLSGPHKAPAVSTVIGGRLCYEDGTELDQQQ